MNDFKYLNFDKPVEEMIKKFNTTTDLAEKKRLSEAISKRRDFMNDLTGGMVEEVKFTFKDRKGGFLDTVVEENFTKEIDKLSGFLGHNIRDVFLKNVNRKINSRRG